MGRFCMKVLLNEGNSRNLNLLRLFLFCSVISHTFSETQIQQNQQITQGTNQPMQQQTTNQQQITLQNRPWPSNIPNTNVTPNMHMEQTNLIGSAIDESINTTSTAAPSNSNQKSSERMRQDEGKFCC